MNIKLYLDLAWELKTVAHVVGALGMVLENLDEIQ